MSVVGDELMVCNVNDNGIMVFNKELERNMIASKVPGRLENICTISSDSHGNLYICGERSPIHVFYNSGEFLLSFSDEKLAGSYGICVAGEYAYATDYHAHDIVAYTTA